MINDIHDSTPIYAEILRRLADVRSRYYRERAVYGSLLTMGIAFGLLTSLSAVEALFNGSIFFRTVTFIAGFAAIILVAGRLIAVPILRWKKILPGVSEKDGRPAGRRRVRAHRHDAGRLADKQRVFDDFCDCARWLVSSGWSRPGSIAINGGSNGGLLVGACITQHPELFGAAVPEVGVLDMLRYHKFTIGWAWKSDFGDPDDPGQYAWLRAYSPLHNIRAGCATRQR